MGEVVEEETPGMTDPTLDGEREGTTEVILGSEDQESEVERIRGSGAPLVVIQQSTMSSTTY